MSRNFSVRGGKKYVKHASDSHAKEERRFVRHRVRGKRRQSVRQEISDTVFADTRNASLVTTIDVPLGTRIFFRFRAQEVAASYTRVRHGTTSEFWHRWNAGIYSTRNKMLVKAITSICSRLCASSIRQLPGIRLSVAYSRAITSAISLVEYK